MSRYARQHVRVLLTGETADELFGGYGRMRLCATRRLVDVAGRVLAPFQRSAALWLALVPRSASASSLSRADWIAASYADGDPIRFATAPLAEWAPYRSQIAAAAVRDHRDPVRQAMAYERLTHLPAIVATGDRMTMGAAIEARLPFTDPELLDFAGLASGREDLFSGPHGKQPLREAMAGRLPAEVINRRKRGWTSPYSIYLRERPELRNWLSKVPTHQIVAASGARPRRRADGRRRVPRWRQPPLAGRLDDRPHRAVAPGVRRGRARTLRRRRSDDPVAPRPNGAAAASRRSSSGR